MVVLYIAVFLSLTTCYSAFTSYMIFYRPKVVQKMYQRITKEHFSSETAKTYSDYPYFVDIRQKFSQKIKDPFKLFMARFFCASLCIVFMAIGLSMNVKLKSVYNCGVVDAGLAITKGRVEGSYISEFGFLGEQKLFSTFIQDLKDYKEEVKHTFDRSYQRLVDKKFENRLENIQRSMNFFHDNVANMTISSCKLDSRKQIQPLLTKEITHYINGKIEQQVKELDNDIENIEKGSHYLKKLVENRDEMQIQKLQVIIDEMYQNLARMSLDFYEVTKFINKLSADFKWETGLLSIIAVFVIIFAFMQMIPPDNMKICKLRAPFQITLQLIISALTIFTGVYFMYKSQLGLQYCRYSFQALDDPEIIKKVFGNPMSKKWAETCLSATGTGEIDSLLDARKEEDFLQSLGVLRGFSMNLGYKLRHKFRMNSLPAMRHYENTISDAEKHVFDLLEKETHHSATHVLQQLNKKLECTGFQIEMSEEQCNFNHHNLEVFVLAKFTSETKESDFKLPMKKSCLVLGNLNSLVDIEKLFKKLKKENPGVCDVLKYDNNFGRRVYKLQECTWSIESYLKDVKLHFQVPKKMVADTIQELRLVEKDFKKVKYQFYDTFHKLSLPKRMGGRGMNITEVLSCNSIRQEAMQILGSVCAGKKTITPQFGSETEQELGLDVVRKGFWISWIFMVAGVALCSASLMRFFSGIIDKQTVRKYQEIRNKESRGRDTQMGWETELGAI